MNAYLVSAATFATMLFTFSVQAQPNTGQERVVLSPFERGFGAQIGNGLRRVLLSSLDPTSISVGAIHEFSTVEGDTDFLEPGFGGTVGIDWTRTPFGSGYIGPVVNVDVFAQSNNDRVQANQLGGVNREVDDAFGINIRPGFRWRTGWNEDTNIFFDGRFLLAYIDTDLPQAAFDPSKIQSPVSRFEQSDWRVGGEVGAGIERQIGNVVVRPGVSVQLINSEHVTGISRQETQMLFSIELAPLRRLNHSSRLGSFTFSQTSQ